MDIESTTIKERLLVVQLLLVISIFFLMGKATFVQVFHKEIISAKYKEIYEQKRNVYQEGERVKNVLNNIANLDLEEIQDEIKKTRDFLIRLQKQKESELNSLKSIQILKQENESQLNFLGKQRDSIQNLISSDVEILKSILPVQQENNYKYFYSFFIGIFTSLAGSYLFAYRKKIVNRIKEDAILIKVIFKKYLNMLKSYFQHE